MVQGTAVLHQMAGDVFTGDTDAVHVQSPTGAIADVP